MCVCAYHCGTTVVHNTAQNSPDNFPFYPADNRHCSHDVYWREGYYFQTVANLLKTSHELVYKKTTSYIS